MNKPELGARVRCVVPGFEDDTPEGVVTGYGPSSPIYASTGLEELLGMPHVDAHPGGNPGVSIRFDDGQDNPDDFYAYDGDFIEVAVVEDEE